LLLWSELKTGHQIVNLLLFSVELLAPKAKNKTVGVARQQRHFLCGDKENEAKESLALRWACLARYRGNINSEKLIRRPCNRSPVLDEALENLYYSGRPKMEASYANPY